MKTINPEPTKIIYEFEKRVNTRENFSNEYNSDSTRRSLFLSSTTYFERLIKFLRIAKKQHVAITKDTLRICKESFEIQDTDSFKENVKLFLFTDLNDSEIKNISTSNVCIAISRNSEEVSIIELEKLDIDEFVKNLSADLWYWCSANRNYSKLINKNKLPLNFALHQEF